jgi:hypothetical protein
MVGLGVAVERMNGRQKLGQTDGRTDCLPDGIVSGQLESAAFFKKTRYKPQSTLCQAVEFLTRPVEVI